MTDNTNFRTAIEALNVIEAHLDSVLNEDCTVDVDKVNVNFTQNIQQEMGLIDYFFEENNFPVDIKFKFWVLSHLPEQIDEIIGVKVCFCGKEEVYHDTDATYVAETSKFLNDMIVNRIYELIQGLYELQDEMEGKL